MSFLGALCQPDIKSGREKSPVLPTRPVARGPLVGADPHEKQARELVECFDFGHIAWALALSAEEVTYLAVHQQGRQDTEGEDGPDHYPEARPTHLDSVG